MLVNVTCGDTIGAGNFGSVFKGSHNGNPVALKQTKDSERALAELWKEIFILRSLREYNNEHVLKVKRT